MPRPPRPPKPAASTTAPPAPMGPATSSPMPSPTATPKIAITALVVSAFAHGANPGTLGSALAGDFGTLTLNADGSYSYVVDNTNATVQGLRLGTDLLTDTFNYTIRDTAGLTTSSTLTITIHGANDNPVAVSEIATAIEAGTSAGVNPDRQRADQRHRRRHWRQQGCAGRRRRNPGGPLSGDVGGGGVAGSLRHADDRGRRHLQLRGEQRQHDRAGAAHLGADADRHVQLHDAGCGRRHIDRPGHGHDPRPERRAGRQRRHRHRHRGRRHQQRHRRHQYLQFQRAHRRRHRLGRRHRSGQRRQRRDPDRAGRRDRHASRSTSSRQASAPRSPVRSAP